MMKLFKKCKDGGPDSPVDAYFLVEIKGLFSIALLRFNKGSRVAFHSHAFNAISWYLTGTTVEWTYNKDTHTTSHKRREGLCFPKYTPRNQFHRIMTFRPAWVLTIRGPWCEQWEEMEFYPNYSQRTVFEHGRKIVKREKV